MKVSYKLFYWPIERKRVIYLPLLLSPSSHVPPYKNKTKQKQKKSQQTKEQLEEQIRE